MRGIVLKYVVVFALVVTSGAMLLDVSQKVQEAEREMRRADRAIERERENIRVLQAEWAYLNDPARLEMISMSGLGMEAPSPESIISELEAIEEMNHPNVSGDVVFHRPAHKPKLQKALVRDISFSASSKTRGAQ